MTEQATPEQVVEFMTKVMKSEPEQIIALFLSSQYVEIVRLRKVLDGIEHWSVDHEDARNRARVALMP